MRKLNFGGASWDSLLLTFVKFVTTLTAIVQTKILSVGLSLTDYGTYSQTNVIISVLTAVLMLGLGDAINYFYNNHSAQNDEAARKKSVNTIFLIEIIVGAIAFAAVLLGQDLIALYFSNDALKALLIFATLKPLLDNVVYFYQILFVSIKKAKLIALRNLVVSLLKLVGVYVAVHVFQNLAVIFATMVLLDLAQLVLFNVLFAKEDFAVNPLQADAKLFKPIIAYGLPMGIFALTNTLARDVDKLVVGRLADTETMAIYANCSKLLPFDIIAGSFATVLIPYIMRCVSSKDYDNSCSLFKNYLKVGYYSVWMLGAAVLLASEQAISFLYSDEYLAGKLVFVAYVLDSMLRFASMHLILTAGGKAKSLMKYSIVSLVINAILNVILYQAVGLLGPAIATLIVSAGYTLKILQKTIRLLNTKWRDVFDIKDMGSFVAILVGTAVVFGIANKKLIAMGMHPYISMIATIGVFLVVNLLLSQNRIKHVMREINQLKL